MNARSRFFVPLILFAVLSTPQRASAGWFVQSGQTFSHYAGSKKIKFGYRYRSLSVLWLDLWTWGGRWVFFDGNDYVPVPDNVLARLRDKIPDADSTPFWYRFPPLFCILLGLGVLASIGYFVEQHEKKRFIRLMSDDRYQEALSTLEHSRNFSTRNQVLERLLEQGVPHSEAEENLGFLLSYLSEQRKSRTPFTLRSSSA